MNIFCKETQAHLQMHPHLQDGSSVGGSTSGGGLITPELWLRDCRSDSPMSDPSLSPPPSSTSAPSTTSRVVNSPPLPAPPPPPPEAPIQPADQKDSSGKIRRAGRLNRRGSRLPITATMTSVTAADLRTASSSSPRSAGSVSPPKHSHLPHLHPLPPPSAQIPPILHSPPHFLPPDPHLSRHAPPPPFLPPGLLPPPHLFSVPHQHPHLNPRFPAALLRPPRTSSSSPPPPLHPPALLPIPHLKPRAPRGAPLHPPPQHPSRFLLPPVTVMVPYPILIPILIPIPIPIPLFPPKNSKTSSADELTTTSNTTTTTTVTSATKQSSNTATVLVPSRCKEGSVEPAPPASPPPISSPAESKSKPSLTPTRPYVSDRPLRKRKRLEVAADEENLGKRKFVPV